MSRRIFLIAALALLTVAMGGCRTAPVKDIPKTPINALGASMEGVEKAILSAGASLGWIMKKRSLGLIEGTLSIRRHMAMVSINYSTTSYSIRYKDSSDLRYSATDKTIHSNYNGWIDNLNNAIRSHLAML